jgi:hypothetical protein
MRRHGGRVAGSRAKVGQAGQGRLGIEQARQPVAEACEETHGWPFRAVELNGAAPSAAPSEVMAIEGVAIEGVAIEGVAIEVMAKKVIAIRTTFP